MSFPDKCELAFLVVERRCGLKLRLFCYFVWLARLKKFQHITMSSSQQEVKARGTLSLGILCHIGIEKTLPQATQHAHRPKIFPVFKGVCFIHHDASYKNVSCLCYFLPL